MRRELYEDWLDEPDAFVLLAETDDGQAIGYALVHLRGPEETWQTGERIGVLETLAVLPGERGRGIGLALFERIYEELRGLGVQELEVAVISKNAAALRFYERHGLLPFTVFVPRTRGRTRGGSSQTISSTIRAIPTPAAVMLSGGPAWRQKPGSARDAVVAALGRLARPVVVVPAVSAVGHAGTDFPMAQQTTRNLKLVQYLNEAYGKEKELETALQAHIAMTTKPPYKRLQQHLKETKAHARGVQRRIKQLGGEAQLVPGPGPVGEAASKVTATASKAVAAAQGPLHALRARARARRCSRTPGPSIQRVRGDRHLHGDRDARRDGRGQGHRQARPRHQARGGAHGEVPRGPDPAAHEGRRARGDPGRRAAHQRARASRSS